MKTSKTLGRSIVYAGLILAILLAAAGMRSSRTTIKLAGKAQPETCEAVQVRFQHFTPCRCIKAGKLGGHKLGAAGVFRLFAGFKNL